MTSAMTLKEKWEAAKAVANEGCRHFEGCHLTSYILKGETWATLGWGEAIPLAAHPKTITQEEADRRLVIKIDQKASCLQREIPSRILEKFSPEQLGGLIMWRYNVLDQAWLSPKCKTRIALVRGDVKKFLDMHGLWIHGNDGAPLVGLVRRRRVERDLIEGKPLSAIKAAQWYQGLYR